MIQTNGKKIFEAVGADAVFTTCDYLRRYVTSFFTEGGFVLTDKDGTTMYTDARYTEAAEKALRGTEVRVAEMDRFANTPTELLKKYKTVGIPFELTFYPEYKKLSELGISLVDSMPAFRKCMAVKNESELAAIAKACDIAEEGFLKLLPEITLFSSATFLGTEWKWWIMKVSMTCLVLVWNYIGRKLFVFK